MKVDIERFGRNNILQDFKFVKNIDKITVDVWGNNSRKLCLTTFFMNLKYWRR